MKKILYLLLGMMLAGGSLSYAATVLMVPNGGTGATSFTAGDCLKGNGTGAITTGACGGGSQTPWTSAIDGGGYALSNVGAITGTYFTATSTTASTFAGNVGIGTTSPYAKLSVAGQVVADYFTATSTTANGFAGALGSVTLPTYSFAGDTNTGIYSSGADSINFAINGDSELQITNATISVTGGNQIKGSTGSATEPSYSFAADSNTGMYSGGTDILGFSTAGTERGRFDATGNLGIGTTSPYAKLSVVGNVVADAFVATSTTAASSIAYYLGIGNTVPTYSLDISGDTLNTSGILQSRSSESAFGATHRWQKSRGTEAVPTGVLAGDIVSRIFDGYAYSDGAYRSMGIIDLTAGASTTNAIGGRFNVALNTSAGALINRFNILETGNAYLNGNLRVGASTAPTVALDVTGAINSTLGIAGSYLQGAYLQSTSNAATTYPSSVSSTDALIVYGNTGAAFTERLRVLAGGNMGIGTTSPYAKLSVAGEVVASHFTATTTATSTFAGVIKANGGCIGCAKTVYKSADETVNNSSVMQDDDTLIIPVGQNEKWAFRIMVTATSNVTPDIKLGFSVPAGTTMKWRAANDNSDITRAAADTEAIVVSDTTERITYLEGVIVSAGTAGNVTLQWAQNTADLSDTIVKSGSHLVANRIE